MSKPIPSEFRDLFYKRAFASLGTLRPDGSPQVTPVWVDIENDSVLVNTAKGRHQDENIRKDSRVGIVVTDPDDPYRYLEVRGRAVEVTGRDVVAHLNAMAKKYLGIETYPNRPLDQIRVLYRIEADRINAFAFPLVALPAA